MTNLSVFFSSLFVCLLVATDTYAKPAQPSDKEPNPVTQLDKKVITGQSSAVYDKARPTIVMDGEGFSENSHQNLGDLLEHLPGISNASFGPGVGRPVVHGMSASRVKILTNGLDSDDVSAMSSDHAPMVDPGASKSVEVIQGPAALRYGGSAIGGAVNVISDRIAEVPANGTQGEVRASIGTNASDRSLAANLHTGLKQWTLHLDAFQRQSNDYSSGSHTSKRSGLILNSDTRGNGAAIGLSYADMNLGYAGVSLSTLNYDYGVPNEKNIDARVVPEQTRYDYRSALYRPVQGIDEWRLSASYNDYQHDETDRDIVAGLFIKDTWQLQTELDHRLGSWQATSGIQVSRSDLKVCHDHSGCPAIADHSHRDWDGTQGSNFTRAQGYDFAHGTPMPLTLTTDLALYWIAEQDWQEGNIELGVRTEQRQIETDESSIHPVFRRDRSYYRTKHYRPLTLSSAATWRLNDQQRLGINLARTQRAPDASEVYWNGDHHATFSFQLDNADLKAETAWTIDMNWLYESDSNQLRAAVYWYEFNDYIYNDLKPLTDPFHGNDVYRHEQTDVRFIGGEAGWQHQLSSSWQTYSSVDWVRASQIDNGRPLPRTPPATLSVAAHWHYSHWHVNSEVRHYLAQNRVASEEPSSEAYSHLNIAISYRLPVGDSDLSINLTGKNLTDEYGQLHTSYLKQYAPVRGRNIHLGASLAF